MPDIIDSYTIILRPGASKSPYIVRFTVESALGENDGEIPYGDSLAACVVKIYGEADDVDRTSEILDSDTINGNDVELELNYPDTTGPGHYYLVFTYTTQSGYTDVIIMGWIVAKLLSDVG